MTAPILEFRGPTRWLSNFEECPVEYEGIIYPTNEHAYQAAKSLDPEVRKTIAALETPGKARRAGQKIALRPGWDEMKIEVMFDINWLKFQVPAYREKLLATVDAHLEEGNTHGDRFWGTVGGEGRNELGKVLMRIRMALQIEWGTPGEETPPVYGEPFCKRAIKAWEMVKAFKKANAEWRERVYGKDPSQREDPTEDPGHEPNPTQGGSGQDR